MQNDKPVKEELEINKSKLPAKSAESVEPNNTEETIDDLKKVIVNEIKIKDKAKLQKDRPVEKHEEEHIETKENELDTLKDTTSNEALQPVMNLNFEKLYKEAIKFEDTSGSVIGYDNPCNPGSQYSIENFSNTALQSVYN